MAVQYALDGIYSGSNGIGLELELIIGPGKFVLEVREMKSRRINGSKPLRLRRTR